MMLLKYVPSQMTCNVKLFVNVLNWGNLSYVSLQGSTGNKYFGSCWKAFLKIKFKLFGMFTLERYANVLIIDDCLTMGSDGVLLRL
jgi:hypothetical protein